MNNDHLEHAEDISIGDDKWIKWQDLPDGEAFEIDHLLKKTLIFWENLNTESDYADGIERFSFWSLEIQTAVEKSKIINFSESLTKLIESIQDIDNNLIHSDILDEFIHKKTFLELLKQIKRSTKA